MKKCLFKVFVLSTIVSLISCQNFLDGSKLKDLLEKEVFIASSIRPEITSVSPTYVEGGVYSDSNIIVVFSKKMDKKYFSDFSYISITDSSGVSLLEHYFPPKLSDDGLTLTIAYNSSNSINIPEGTIKTVKVRLSSEISDYETIPLKNDYTWTFNLNSKTDDKAPEFLTGTVLTGNTAVPMAEGTFDSILTSIGADNFFTDTYHCNSVNIN